MKILLIKPKPSPETIGLQHLMIVEPLELEVLASLVRPADVPVLIDLMLEKRPLEYFLKVEEPDIVCVTGYITDVPAMREYSRLVKKMNPDTATVVGGVHCEVCPEDLNYEFIDYRVVRNATAVFRQLLDHIRGDENIPEGVLRPGDVADKNHLPAFRFDETFPRRDLTSSYRRRYFYIFHDKVALIKTAFGCPHRCTFCFCHQITDGIYHERPMESVIDELSDIDEREVYIVDDDFLVREERVVSFIEACRKAGLNKNFLIYGRADFISENPDVIGDFKNCGLRTVIVGLESFSESELSRYNKRAGVAVNFEALDVLNRYGIDCYATIIVSPEWSAHEFCECADILKRHGIHYVNLQPLTPLPGTYLAKDGHKIIVSYDDFEKWDLAHVTIEPMKMSLADYYKNIIKLYESIIYQPRYLGEYLRKYPLFMIWKMLGGSMRIRRQYMNKLKEAQTSVENSVYSADAVRPPRSTV